MVLGAVRTNWTSALKESVRYRIISFFFNMNFFVLYNVLIVDVCVFSPWDVT